MFELKGSMLHKEHGWDCQRCLSQQWAKFDGNHGNLCSLFLFWAQLTPLASYALCFLIPSIGGWLFLIYGRVKKFGTMAWWCEKEERRVGLAVLGRPVCLYRTFWLVHKLTRVNLLLGRPCLLVPTFTNRRFKEGVQMPYSMLWTKCKILGLTIASTKSNLSIELAEIPAPGWIVAAKCTRGI